MDVLGAVVLVAASVLTLLGLEWGGKTYPWNSPAVLCCLIIGIMMFGVFALVEIKHAVEPIIPMHLFKVRNFAAADIAGFFQGGVLFCLSFYLPLWFQVVRGASPTMSGVQTLVSSWKQLKRGWFAVWKPDVDEFVFFFGRFCF